MYNCKLEFDHSLLTGRGWEVLGKKWKGKRVQWLTGSARRSQAPRGDFNPDQRIAVRPAISCMLQLVNAANCREISGSTEVVEAPYIAEIVRSCCGLWLITVYVHTPEAVRTSSGLFSTDRPTYSWWLGKGSGRQNHSGSESETSNTSLRICGIESTNMDCWYKDFATSHQGSWSLKLSDSSLVSLSVVRSYRLLEPFATLCLMVSEGILSLGRIRAVKRAIPSDALQIFGVNHSDLLHYGD